MRIRHTPEQQAIPRGTLETSTVIYFALPFLLPLLFTAAGLVCMWISKVWTTTDKLICTVAILALPALTWLVAATAYASFLNVVAQVATLAALTATPVACAIFLWLQARDHPRKRDLPLPAAG